MSSASHRPAGPKPLDAARAEAAAWISRLHGPDRTPEIEAGLRRWLEEDANHARAFERMTQAWDDATAIVAGDHFPRVRIAAKPASPRWRMAAAVMAATGLAAWAGYGWFAHPSYATGIGEQRTVRLDDGSRVSLNSGSEIVVKYARDKRLSYLEQGEVFFEVVADPLRPFVVVAGDHEIKALGTSFVVRRDRERTAVTLVEGKVAVSAVASALPGLSPAQSNVRDAGAVSLSVGQRVTFVSDKPARFDVPALESVTAWRRGDVVLERTRLEDAAADMNRYDSTRLVIDDPVVAAMQVSGIYRSGDNANFARVLARMHGLTVIEKEGEVHLRR